MMTDHTKNIIKIGILCDGPVMPLWVHRVVESISVEGVAEITLIVFHDRGKNLPKSAPESLVYRLHKKIDHFICHNRIDYNQPADLSRLSGKTTVIDVSEADKEADLVKILHQELVRHPFDVILDFSTQPIDIPGEVTATYGIWHYRMQGSNLPGSMESVYRAMIRKEEVIDVSLHSNQASSGQEVILHRSYVPTQFTSIHINLDHVCNMASIVIPRLIRKLYEEGPDLFRDLHRRYAQMEVRNTVNATPPPANFRACINLIKVLYRYLFNRLMLNERWKWHLLHHFDDHPFPDVNKTYKALSPPGDRFWADPFPVWKDHKIFIFIEEVVFKKAKGYIAVLELDNEGNFLHSEPVLKKPYHLSYPFILEIQANYYMIPETSENKTIELYKCEHFPGKWSFVMNLMENINARDTTFFFYDNKWWMFTAINEFINFEEHAELFLFYSDDLFTTKWKSHPANPIVTDIRTARPAGKVFVHNGKIYRPSQDCSVRYGRALNMHKIITLNEISYTEVMVSRTEALWSPKLKGTHTFNVDRDFAVLDAYRY